MIRIDQTSRCCGCAACVSTCPVHCISMQADEEGFSYPSVDTSRCVGCGACERVCPFAEGAADDGAAPRIAAYATRTRDKELLAHSSSGGVFSELCKPVLAAGGVVFGVAMASDCKSCSFVAAHSEVALVALRGSKYMQADARGVYERVREELRTRRPVLFSGTPCQVNALKGYLDSGYENLLTVDCVCHGVPSPKLWSQYVQLLEQRHGEQVRSVAFRNKHYGWKRFSLRFDIASQTVFEPLDTSAYLQLFLRNLSLRPSCYACRTKTRRLADISLADFWGVKQVVPRMADDQGCSLVITRTEAGAAAFANVCDALDVQEVSYEEAVRRNSAEYASVVRPPERDEFFQVLFEHGCKEAVRCYGQVSVAQRAKAAVKRLLFVRRS